MKRKIRGESFEYTSGTQLDNAVWDDMAQKYILEDEFEKLGIAVGEGVLVGGYLMLL